jgi:hypothetical protein
VGDALDALITPARGVGWRVLTSGAGYVYIDVYSYFTDENYDVNVIDATDRRIQPTLNIEHSKTFDMIFYRGGPITVCGTWAINDALALSGILVAGWSATQEIAYCLEGLGDEEANDKARNAEVHSAVYQKFVVPVTWDWMFGAFNGSPMPTAYGGLDYTAQSPQANGKQRFMRTIPIYQDADDGSLPELRKPFVIVWAITEAGGACS